MSTNTVNQSVARGHSDSVPIIQAPTYLVLVALAIFAAVYPCFELGNVEISFLDVPALLTLLWFRGKHLLALLTASAALAYVLWGTHELDAWIATYSNSYLLILTIKWIKSEHRTLGLAVIGFGYWTCLGVPLTYLAFWLPAFDADYALAATGQRLFSGVSCITLVTALHFTVVLLQHRLPNLFFGGPRRFTIRMREISETAALLAASAPLLALLWVVTNEQIEANIQRLFAASNARFEALALTASADIATQRARLNQLTSILPRLLSNATADPMSRDREILDALGIPGNPHFIIRIAEQDSPFTSSNFDALNLQQQTFDRLLDETKDEISIALTDDPEGPVAFIPNADFPRLVLVYPTPVDLWQSLYGSDMLGHMTGKIEQGVIDRVSHFHGPSAQALYGISDSAKIIDQQYDYAIWVPPARVTLQENRFKRLRDLKNSYITFQASDELIGSFDRDLFDVDCFRFTVDFWSHIGASLKNFTLWIFGGSLLLLIMAAAIEFVVGRFSRPFDQLIGAMEHVANNPITIGRASFTFDTTKATSQFQRLVNAFKTMDRSISQGFERTVALNTSYESLLDNAQLGFIAFSKTGDVAYENVVARELVSKSPDLLPKIENSLPDNSDVIPVTTENSEGQMNVLMSRTARINTQGEPDGYWIILTDISDLKRAEREMLAAQRLSTLGEMTTGMAHEINQPLQTIALSLANLRHLLKEPLSQAPKASEKIDRTLEAVRKISELINFMKTYGGIRSLHGEVFNPAAVLIATVEEYERQHNDVIALEYRDQTGNAVTATGNPEQFKVAISHLIRNAIDAANEKLRDNQTEAAANITISIKREEQTIIIVAEDTCGGIHRDHIERVFDPFFTTKDPDKGMGLGLSVTHGIIAAMGGRIDAANNQHGATFTIKVPTVDPTTD